MPLEIRELIIRTQIVTDERHDRHPSNDWQNEVDMKTLIDQCVNKVIKALSKKTER